MNRKIEIRTKEVEVVTDVFCNKCGESCKKHHGFYGLIDAVVSGGYGSDPLRDCTAYIFSLCEKCLHQMFQEFKIPVERHDWSSSPESLAHEEYEYDAD